MCLKPAANACAEGRQARLRCNINIRLNNMAASIEGNDKGEIRSEVDVSAVMEFAKLNKTEIHPTTQCVKFGTHLENGAFKLIELNSDMVDNLKAGHRLVIRGSKTDEAVLCTANKSYCLKEVDISNSLILVPDLIYPDQLKQQEAILHREVTSVLHTYFELRPCKPRLKKLKALLEENTYNGLLCENDTDHQGKKYTFEELLDIVQASEEELKGGLEMLQACFIDGYYRVLDFDFHQRVLTNVLQLIDENEWSLNSAPLQHCYMYLDELFMRCIIKHVLVCYSTSNDDQKETYSLSEDKICRFFAELLLKYTEKFNFKDFMESWQQSVPNGLKTHLSQLEGLALINRKCQPEIISYFPLSELSEDVNERFNCLFKTQERWTLDEITPYIRDCVVEKMNVPGLLTKHARMSVQNGIKMYTSKKPLF